MPLSDLIPSNLVDWKKDFWNDSWNSNVSTGQYFAGAANAGGSLRRGGFRAGTTLAGVFSAHLVSTTDTALSYIGFRCTVSRP